MTPTDDKKSYKTVNMDKRGSGILLHITSLPSSYGVGDLGPEAYRFVDFLKKTKQRYWQVLPLNPTDPLYGNSHEPFEAFCSENSSWLEDFSVFVVLKKHFGGKVWNQWPKKLRDRNLKALKEIKKNVIPKSKRKNSGNIFFIRSGTRLNVIVKKRG